MDRLQIHDTIRQTVQTSLPGSRIFLFGSRARGTGDRLSDYDLLIITPDTFTPQEKIFWNNRLDREIVKAIKAPIDLLLNSEEEINQKRELPGHIIRTAIKEGVVL